MLPKNSNFFLSASNFNQKGIVPGTGYDKTTFRFNGEQKFLDIFTVSANVAYSVANTDRTLTSGGLYNSSGSGALASVYTWAPSDNMTHWANEDGSRYKLADVGEDLDPWDEKNNPYWIINKDHYFDKTERFTGAINVRADIAKWWFINYRVGVDTYNQTNSTRVASNGVVKQVWQKGMMSDNMLKYTYMSHNVMSNWNAKVGQFTGNIMLGMQTDDISTDRNYKMAWNFEVPEFFSYANANYYTLVTSHCPDIFDSILGYHSDLLLSGHSRGGQIYIPLLSLFGRDYGCKKYYHGKTTKDGATIDVSNGLGMIGDKARFLADAEIVLYTFRSAD